MPHVVRQDPRSAPPVSPVRTTIRTILDGPDTVRSIRRPNRTTRRERQLRHCRRPCPTPQTSCRGQRRLVPTPEHLTTLPAHLRTLLWTARAPTTSPSSTRFARIGGRRRRTGDSPHRGLPAVMTDIGSAHLRVVQATPLATVADSLPRSKGLRRPALLATNRGERVRGRAINSPRSQPGETPATRSFRRTRTSSKARYRCRDSSHYGQPGRSASQRKGRRD